MPIEYKGKKYEFGNLVKKIKKSKPGIKSPGGYVKRIEQNQHLSQKIEELKMAARFTDEPMGKEINDRLQRIKEIQAKPFKTKGDTAELQDHQRQIDEYAKITGKQRPPKPTQKDRTKIIQARLNDLREEITERKIARLHDHRIEWHENPIGTTRVASLVDASGKFVKYWLLNAKEINGNGWGVSPISIAQNIKKFKGKPFVITAQTWIPESEYGMEFRHPTIMSNDLGTIFRYQAKYAVGLIRDVYEEKENWYATVEMSPKYAHLALPPFCSPAIFQLDPFESEGSLTKWEALHLAGLFEQPAYGAQIALLKGTCIGTPDQCRVQFKGAQLKKNEDFEQVKEAAIGIDFESPQDRLDKLKKYPPRIKFNRDFNDKVLEYIDKGSTIKPKKPTQKNRKNIISAKLAALRSETNSTVNRLNLLRRKGKKVKMAQDYKCSNKVCGETVKEKDRTKHLLEKHPNFVELTKKEIPDKPFPLDIFFEKSAQAEGTTNVFNMTYDKSKPRKTKRRYYGNRI